MENRYELTIKVVGGETDNKKTISDPFAEKKKIDKDTVVGEGVGFERIRRITGYLVGTLDRFNGAKRSEVNDRVKHSIGSDKMEQL